LRAYEELLKAQKTGAAGGEDQQLQRQTELESFMESQGLGRYMANLKKWGVCSLAALQGFELKKLGLLPGHEIKLAKRLAEMGRPGSRDESTGHLRPDESFEDDVLVNRLTPEQTSQKNPNKFSSILLRLQTQSRNLAEQETRKVKVEFVAPSVAKKEMKSCGNDSAQEESRRDYIGCWVCLKLFPRSQVKSHPIIENKVRVSLQRCSVRWPVCERSSRRALRHAAAAGR
jgi:hypothetical protein